MTVTALVHPLGDSLAPGQVGLKGVRLLLSEQANRRSDLPAIIIVFNIAYSI